MVGSEVAAMPERVGRYEIVLPIAKGGMATVYLARASGVGGFDRYVALKLTAAHLRDDPSFAKHLIDEAKLVAHLRHTNVVPVYDVGECEHGVFLVMEYVPGDSFAGLRRAARERGGELPQRVALRVLCDALLGLHAAHEHADEDGAPLGLVHRDFSPQNILVGTDGIARLTDFGIAKAASRVSNTGAGLVKGKLRYVAPEQARGETLDRRCDVWAAGVIAWEILAGQKLVTADGSGSVAVPKEDPPRVRSVAPEISETLDALVARALRVDRTARLETAQHFARALSSAARTAGLLADADEVAEHVNRLAGPELAERKSRLAEARRQRRYDAPDVRTMVGLGASLAPARAQLPSLPEVPISPLSVPEPPGSELGIEVNLGPDPADRASEGILGGPATSIAPADESTHEVYESPVAPPRSAARRAFDAIAARALPWSRKKTWIAAASAGVVVVVVVVAIAAGGSSGPPPMRPASASATVSSASAPAAAIVVPSAPAAPAVAADVNEEASPMLHVTANAPIAKVSIAGRAVDAEVPAPTLGVELGDEDQGKTLKVVVTSIDGRVASATAEPGTRELEVAFGDRRAAPPPPAAAAAPPKEKRTWPKRGPK